MPHPSGTWTMTPPKDFGDRLEPYFNFLTVGNPLRKYHNMRLKIRHRICDLTIANLWPIQGGKIQESLHFPAVLSKACIYKRSTKGVIILAVATASKFLCIEISLEQRGIGTFKRPWAGLSRELVKLVLSIQTKVEIKSTRDTKGSGLWFWVDNFKLNVSIFWASLWDRNFWCVDMGYMKGDIKMGPWLIKVSMGLKCANINFLSSKSEWKNR